MARKGFGRRDERVSLVLAAAMGAMAFGAEAPAAAHARMQASQLAAEVRSYQIPAGTVGMALNRLAEENGVQMVFLAGLTRNARTSGLKGEYTLGAALDELLAGTGLGYRLADDEREVFIVLAQNGAVRSDASGAEALPPIDVGAERAPGAKPMGRGPGRADPSKETGYARTTSFGATKTDTPLIDTPMAVQIVPHEVIEDQQALTTREAVRGISGVQPTDNYYERFYIRGFNSGYGLNHRNSLRMEGTIGLEDIAFTDRIEVIKGPASMLYGRIEPGGMVNVVTKRPLEDFRASLEQQAGSFGLARTVADVTGPIDAEKTVLYRLMGVYDHADSFTNHDHRDNGAGALFLTFKPAQNVEFNVQFEHYERRQTTPQGSGSVPVHLKYDQNGQPLVIPGYNDRPLYLPRSFSAADPTMWNNFPHVEHRTLYYYDWTWRFDEKWKLTNRFHYVDINETQSELANYGGFDGGFISRNFYYQPRRRGVLSTNLDLAGEFETGFLTHKTLVGADWYKYQDDWFGYCCSADGLIPPLNVYAPGAGGYFGGLLGYYANVGRRSAFELRKWSDLGFYAQDQISFWDDRIHLLLGGRWDKATSSISKTIGDEYAKCFPYCTGYPMGSYPEKGRLSPRAGLLFKLDEDTSIYGSYVRSFGANGYAGYSPADKRMVAPEVGVQWEIGLKRQWFDGRLSASIALFDLTKKNLTQPNPQQPASVLTVGEVKSRGVELDVSGQVTENLSLIGSYTFDVVKITDDANRSMVGKRYFGAAPNFGSLWAKWDTAPGSAQGWELGAGVYATDERWGDNINSWKLPSYARFDAMAAYRLPIDGHKVTLRINVKNIGDQRYFEFADGYGFAYYGQPRTVIGSVNFQW
jgi:iron complex outermembrane receptor protein